MLLEQQIKVIRKYIPEEYYDVEKVIHYLSIHSVVGEDIFRYVAKDGINPKDADLNSTVFSQDILDGNKGVLFDTLSVEQFIRRIPFYFPVKEHAIDLYDKRIPIYRFWFEDLILYGDIRQSDLIYAEEKDPPLTMERVYAVLEFILNDTPATVEDIDNYVEQISIEEGQSYFEWLQYVEYCWQLNIEEYFPSNFFYKYNLAREALGLNPVLFLPEAYTADLFNEGSDEMTFTSAPYMYYSREGNILDICGRFPLDENNEPVMRWIGVETKDADSVKCWSAFEGMVLLRVILRPTTIVRILIPKEHSKKGTPIIEGGYDWVTIYSGAQTVSFNAAAIKKRRKVLGFTQAQVAEAVQANLRTYQKWENGESVPDGFFLLRIINWLDIPNINDVISCVAPMKDEKEPGFTFAKEDG